MRRSTGSQLTLHPDVGNEVHARIAKAFFYFDPHFAYGGYGEQRLLNKRSCSGMYLYSFHYICLFHRLVNVIIVVKFRPALPN